MARLVIPPRMKEWSLWALWWLLLGGAILWLLVGSVGYWVTRGWLPPDASGWAQAVGSLLAVVAAIGIARYQVWREAFRERQKSEVLAVLLREIAARSIAAANLVLDHLDGHRPGGLFDRQFTLQMIKDQVDTLNGFEIKELPTVEVAEAFLRMRGALTSSLGLVEHANSQLGGFSQITLSLHMNAKAVELAARGVLKSLDR